MQNDPIFDPSANVDNCNAGSQCSVGGLVGEVCFRLGCECVELLLDGDTLGSDLDEFGSFRKLEYSNMSAHGDMGCRVQ